MTQETKVLFILGIITIVIVVVGAILLGNNSAQNPTSSSQKVDEKILVRKNSNKIATSSATITLVEFADFQCPACASSHPMVKQILEDKIGKINFVFRHFPLAQHQNALIAAQAAEAAGEQGKFWEMSDMLFSNQSTWSEIKDPLETFIVYAGKLQLDLDKFKKSIENGMYREKINNDQSDGVSIGVNSTPTFFINGEKTDSGNVIGKIEEALKK